MKKEKKEIRDVLMGRTVLDEDGNLTTLEPGMFRVPQGVVDGAGGVFLFGIARKARLYETDFSEGDTLAWADWCMASLGRTVRLRTQPEAAACRIRYMLTRPAVLTFRFMEGRPVLTAWAGRGLTARISLRRALRAFQRQLPEGIRPSSEQAPREKRGKGNAGQPPAASQETWTEDVPDRAPYDAETPEQENWTDQGAYGAEMPEEETWTDRGEYGAEMPEQETWTDQGAYGAEMPEQETWTGQGAYGAEAPEQENWTDRAAYGMETQIQEDEQP